MLAQKIALETYGYMRWQWLTGFRLGSPAEPSADFCVNWARAQASRNNANDADNGNGKEDGRHRRKNARGNDHSGKRCPVIRGARF